MNEAAKQHLERAQEFLAIAGAVDPKRDAYIKAATELALFRDTSPKQWRQAAASYCNTSTATVDKLVKWHDAGFTGKSPFLMDGEATKRAARSHAKKVLADPEERAKVLSQMTEQEVSAVEADALHERVERKLAPARKAKAEHQAVRAEHHPEPDAIISHHVMHRIRQADEALRDAIQQAETVKWSDKRSDWLLKRIRITAELLDLLRMAVTNTGNVDWDAELARLTAEAETAGKE